MHPQIPHPRDHMPVIAAANRLIAANEAVLEWVTSHMLSSIFVFDIALLVPLISLPMPDTVKLTVGVVSGSWFQWWALPALQRTQVKADLKRDAKADADHLALTHIATRVDAVATHLGIPED